MACMWQNEMTITGTSNKKDTFPKDWSCLVHEQGLQGEFFHTEIPAIVRDISLQHAVARSHVQYLSYNTLPTSVFLIKLIPYNSILGKNSTYAWNKYWHIHSSVLHSQLHFCLISITQKDCSRSNPSCTIQKLEENKIVARFKCLEISSPECRAKYWAPVLSNCSSGLQRAWLKFAY